MVITSIAYANEANTRICVVTTDEGTFEVSWPGCTTYHREFIQAWIDTPNTISAWVDPVDYMALMRQERDRRIDSIYWRVERNQTQKAGGQYATDDETTMADIYAYLQDLRDMPENNPDTDTKAKYNALVWPTEPE